MSRFDAAWRKKYRTARTGFNEVGTSFTRELVETDCACHARLADADRGRRAADRRRYQPTRPCSGPEPRRHELLGMAGVPVLRLQAAPALDAKRFVPPWSLDHGRELTGARKAKYINDD